MPTAPDGGARPGRRRALRLVLAGAALVLAGGHAPYGQWGVYRKRRLLILTMRADPASHALGERLAAVLAERLPESRAEVTRAPHLARVASLIATRQLDLALMRRDDAAALRQGAPPFADYGPVPLRTLVGLGDYLLVCRADFPARHGWLVAEALSRGREALPVPLSPAPARAEPPDGRVPLHPGARAYFTGAPLPEAGPDDDHDHPHEEAQPTGR